MFGWIERARVNFVRTTTDRRTGPFDKLRISPKSLIGASIMCDYVCRCFVRNYDMIFLCRKDADFDSGIFIS